MPVRLGIRWAASILAVSIGLAVPGMISVPAFAAPVSPKSLLGSQGTDVALPDTDSALTLPGFGRYRGMSFHVSKTRSLTNEAVSVSWTGGAPGSVDGPIESTNFVQIMQCWGDPVNSANGTVGPPPQQCVFGADPDGLRTNASNNGFQFTRARMPAVENWVPFKSADGTVINADTGQNPNDPSSSIWINPFYTKYTSNEITGLRNAPDGSGTAFFEMHTGSQNAGLGCGQRQKNGKMPRCWLVVVPRGPHDDVAGVDDRGAAATTPLDERGPWKGRVAFSLDFTPVKSSCALSNDQQSISGADLTLPAMDRWLPRICTQAGAPPYIYTRTQDDRARTLLGQRANGGAGDGMIITNSPVDPATLPPGRRAVYAPVDVSAVAVGFSIQRNNIRDGLPDTVLKAFERVQSTYVAHIKLTPRLVAKLLTQSYAGYLSPGTAFQTNVTNAKYDWSVNNPQTMLFDPDFIALNPEFGVLGPPGIDSATTLEVSLGSSAAATAVWNWIKADPSATSWLGGAPDRWGMRVNPYYSTVAVHNPNRTAFQLPPSGGFPKNDPLAWLTPDAQQAKLPALSLNNEWPYQDSLTSTAKVTRTGNRGARINFDPNTPQGYAPSGSQTLGSRAMLCITDAADAQRFGLQLAALQNAHGDFVEPTDQGLSAAVAAMRADPTSGVLQTDSRAHTAGAYPLTTVDYAASVPSVLTTKERKDYARLLTFIADQGQVPGEAPGQLPRGYLPLPAPLRAATRTASSQVAAGLPATPPPAATSPHPTSSATNTPLAPLPTATASTTPPSTPISRVANTPPDVATPGPTTTPQATGRPAQGPTATAAPARTPATGHTAEPKAAAAIAGTTVSVRPGSSAPPSSDVQLAANPTPADPPTAPWVAIVFAVGLAAAVAVPVVGRTAKKRG